jgi:putative SOS response-associated peptidase YedK
VHLPSARLRGVVNSFLTKNIFCTFFDLKELKFMCYSNSSTSKNVDLAKKYKKKVPPNMDETPVFFASGFSFSNWRIVTKDDTLQVMQWGLIPAWFKGDKPNEIAAMTLNAKVETLDEKASFKHLLHRQECIIPSTGFFEWKTIGKEKIPYFIYPSTDAIFSMAGLYDQWLDPASGKTKRTFTLLTGPANPLMAEIHNSKKRMPVILDPNKEESWLAGDLNPESLLEPISDRFMGAHEVNRKLISSKQHNCPEVLVPFHNSIFEQGSLF